MKQPRVSILITAYNRKSFLPKAVASALNQDANKEDFEIVVIKNFDLPEVDELEKDGKLRCVKSNEASLGKFIYEGSEACNGVMLSILDDDDMWDSHKVSRIIEVMNKYQNIGYYHNSVQPISESDELIPRGRNFESAPWKSEEEFAVLDEDNKERASHYIGKFFPDFNLSSTTISRQILKENEQYMERAYAAVDTFLFMIAMASDRAMFLDSRKLTLYRKHSQNVSGGDITSVDSYLSSMYTFTETSDKAYSLIVECALNTNKQYLHKVAHRRYAFTRLLNSIQSSDISRSRTFNRMLKLVPYMRTYYPALNAKACALALVYVLSPSYGRKLLAENM